MGRDKVHYPFHSSYLCLTDSFYRKVEGEVKGDDHGGGGKKLGGQTVPLRRWEDWERSRLRKLRRDERRRRDFERSHPAGYIAGNDDLLGVRDARSQYDGSDGYSIASSEDDHWGGQIGGYNENSTQYPPPPVGLIMIPDTLDTAKTVDASELEAMLESGFDDRGRSPNTAPAYTPRFQLSDNNSSTQLATGHNGYAPLTRTASPTNTPTSPSFGASRAGPGGARERYGPLGPLDPATNF